MPTIPVLDSFIHYRETGSDQEAGVPLVLLHGNPTSSHLWRDVIPALNWTGRVLAPDLIGMGDSGKPAIDYTFDDQARYLDAWFEEMGLDEVVLVGHDWGGALAFDWAARHPGRVKGIAFTETIVKPMAWEEFPKAGAELFAAIKTPGVGETMLLEQNMFLDLSGTVAGPLSDEDAAIYQKPFPTPESRRPVLQWARSMPLGGEPADVVARVEAYDKWLATTPEVPKLLITFEPSFSTMMGPDMYEWCAQNMAALRIDHHDLVAGHHTPEDHPEAIAASISAWAADHGLRG